ncbi:MAG: hypothetical protein H7267_05850 [Sandarakinorhabdus sp.]|nr:hypothetical protein [Sandarakinorhabdus sp.]
MQNVFTRHLTQSLPVLGLLLLAACSRNASNPEPARVRSITDRRPGDFVLSVTIDEVTNGVIDPAGQGLYMPVDAVGRASLHYAPQASRPRSLLARSGAG